MAVTMTRSPLDLPHSARLLLLVRVMLPRSLQSLRPGHEDDACCDHLEPEGHPAMTWRVGLRGMEGQPKQHEDGHEVHQGGQRREFQGQLVVTA